MRRTLLTTTAMIMFAVATPTFAAVATPEELVAQYQAAGATRIEVKVGPTQTKVEAIKGGAKEEVVYDNATGDVIKREVELLEGNENSTPGVQISTTDRDFVLLSGGGSGSSSDDEDGDESDDDSEDDDEDDDDDDDEDDDEDDEDSDEDDDEDDEDDDEDN